MIFVPDIKGYIPLKEVINLYELEDLMLHFIPYMDISDLQYWKFIDKTENIGISLFNLNEKTAAPYKTGFYMQEWLGYLCVKIFKCFYIPELVRTLENYEEIKYRKSLFDEENVTELVYGFQLSVQHYNEELFTWVKENNFKDCVLKITLDSIFNLTLIYIPTLG